MKLNTLILENTHGTAVCVMEVGDADLVDAFDHLCTRAEEIACPIIFVNGKGYTSRKEFIEMVQTVNECSTGMGGCAIYPITAHA